MTPILRKRNTPHPAPPTPAHRLAGLLAAATLLLLSPAGPQAAGMCPREPPDPAAAIECSDLKPGPECFPFNGRLPLSAEPAPGEAPGQPQAAADDLPLQRNDDPVPPFALGPGGGRFRLSPGAPGDERPYWRRNLFRRVLADQRFAVTTWWPSEFRRWRFSAPLLIGSVAAATSAGSEPGADARIERDVEAGTSPKGASFARGLTRLGDASTGAVLLGGTYLAARLSGNARLAEASSLSAEALLNSGLWNKLLKESLGRTRPGRGSEGRFFQYDPAPGQQTGAFPSGHAMGAFAVATVFSHEYADRKWVPWVSYGMASLIAASRVSLGRHYPSDVVVGAVLGNSLGRMVIARREGATWDDRRGRLGLVAVPSERTYGVAYSRRW